MDFADVLDRISRPQQADEDMSYSAAGSAAATQFWQVLDRIGETPPVSEDQVKEAYFPDPAPPEQEQSELSLDPEEIAWELDVDSIASLEELSGLRRRFAMLNHPDRTTPAERERANRRMTIANTLIDEASRKFAR